MKTKLSLGFSPCPNDTFIFHAMVHNHIDTKNYSFEPHISDVEDLNLKAFKKAYHVTKLSFHAYLHCRDKYAILDSGAALGYKCGPLLIARDKNINLNEAVIAIPGEYTTANMLLKLRYPDAVNKEITRFDNIISGVASGTYDAGLVIHEGRFVYQQYNLEKILDLGEWWEKETGCPIPLGCIALRKDSGYESTIEDINDIVSRSVSFALQNRSFSTQYIKSHSQEMDDTVINEHINLYVNDFTVNLGKKGYEAVETLEKMAKWKKII